MQPGVTLRDLVHAIPYYAIQQGLLTVEKKVGLGFRVSACHLPRPTSQARMQKGSRVWGLGFRGLGFR